MKITIIGHGNVGSALVSRWATNGHEIVIGARNPKDAKLRPLLAADNVRATTIKESILDTDAIVIAIPAHLTSELAKSLGDLSGRVVIDTTNSVFRRPEPFRTGFEAFQKITGAEVAKCFNSTGAENMRNPFYSISVPSPQEVPVDMFVAGSSRKAKDVATRLAEDAGFICYDFGGDDKVELLEELCRIWIHLAMSGLGRNFAFKILRR